jgi:hypothetical protein
MDNLKKNLHFVVFGAGIALGLILLGAGYFIRSGSEAALAGQIQKLNSKKSVPTQGDLDAAKTTRDRFDADITKAVTQLQGPGSSLLAQGNEPTEPSAFYQQRGTTFIESMRARFGAMEQNSSLPERMKGWTVARTGRPQGNFWNDLDQEIARVDAAKLEEVRTRLRIIEEICIICELLLRDSRYVGQPVKFNGLKVEAKALSDNNDVTSAWWEVPYTLDIECMPAFGYALVSELLRPTDLTTGETNGQTRWMFPNQLDTMQSATLSRQLALRYRITPAMRASENIPDDFDPETPEGKALLDNKVKQFESDVRPLLPMQFAIKLRGLSWNPKWGVVTPPEQS